MTNPTYLKNIEAEKILQLSQLTECREGQIISRTLAQNQFLSITVFAFAKGEELSAHSSAGDAILTILEGKAQIIINGITHHLTAGQTIVMPAQIPHAVTAEEDFKMFLIVVFPQNTL
ncbi:cupin domain-containing protein [Megasphaera cerevisiae]|jgi:quercetin dioxygenase-like cupin family protein|uniref:cupin domain-containing protein n=1 Tax=Megasphaera cerevisiae TaxID=39029 RepID=UPI00094415AF|nr:cupin domain-containing protein [Megasphaera cerevisiae]MCI1750853.1 cupin domain-containing protein [Megasphaera cerevisiae]OKY54175.1 cupin [Megasphaera cerevisiae]